MVEEPVRLKGPILAIVTERRDLDGYSRPRRSFDQFEIDLEIGETYYLVTADEAEGDPSDESAPSMDACWGDVP
ncbi:hypothetical protein [Alienimonas sp. DA493]|uniref:hypothetical protein n=1 Tax=Alienimonas sp. DA493 TaxID=3373605 RepID=UPI0037546943